MRQNNEVSRRTGNDTSGKARLLPVLYEEDHFQLNEEHHFEVSLEKPQYACRMPLHIRVILLLLMLTAIWTISTNP